MELTRSVVRVVLCTAALGFAMEGISLAESGPEYGAPGGYIGLGASFGFENFDIWNITDPSVGYGFDAWGGYKFNRWVATELQIEYLNGFNFWRIPSGVEESGEAVTFTGNAKVYFMKSRFQPFVLAGIGMGYMRHVNGQTGFVTAPVGLATRFGGGFDFYTSEHFALQVNASYVLQFLDVDDYDYVSVVIGGQYRF